MMMCLPLIAFSQGNRVESELHSYVELIVGKGPTDCGSHVSPKMESSLRLELPEVEEPLRQSLECVTRAADEKRPAWMQRTFSGIDSVVFEGFLAGPEGLYRFSFDSAPCGGPGCFGKFSVQRCRQAFLSANYNRSRFAFACSRGS